MSDAPSPLLSAALDVFGSTPATLRALLAKLTEEVTSTPGDEGWSAKDVVAHLVSLYGPTLVDRIRPILELDEPPIPNADEAAILEASGLRGKPLAELLNELERQRRDAVAWLGALSDEQLDRTGMHSAAGRVSVADLIHHKAWHDLSHIEQVCGLIAAPLDAHRGAMRVFR